MRIDVEKVLFFGTPSDMNEFFLKAQEEGIIQFINPDNRHQFSIPEHLKIYLDAIRILKTHFTAKTQETPVNIEAFEMALEVTSLYKEKNTLEEQRRNLISEISRIHPFKDFSLEDITFIKEKAGINIQFFCSRKQLDLQDLPIIYIGTEYGLFYYIALAKEKIVKKGLIPIEITHSLGALNKQLSETEKKILSVEKMLISYTSYYHFIYQGMLRHLNDFYLNQAKSFVQTALQEHLFYIFAFVPKNKKEQLKTILKPLNIECTLVNISTKDKVPTYLENKQIGKLGEDLIGLYDPPANKDRDPSLWVLFSFVLFFSIIISDAGYGFVLFVISLFVMKKFKKSAEVMKRFGRLCLMLSIGTMVWGILTSSYFGIHFSINSKIGQFSFIEQLVQRKVLYHKARNDLVFQQWAKRFPIISELNDPKQILDVSRTEHLGRTNYVMQGQFQRDVLLDISILIGVLHIILSMLRYLPRKLTMIGWILAIIGGYLYFPTVIKASNLVNFYFGMPEYLGRILGLYLLISGIVIVLIIALIHSRWKGLIEITDSIQIFADVLSYLRLYALALAGMVMASTFNDLGVQAGPILGSIIIIFGHFINLSVAIMGGVIHGLRLNFIEWYHYSFEGGGKMFKPLKILE